MASGARLRPPQSRGFSTFNHQVEHGLTAACEPRCGGTRHASPSSAPLADAPSPPPPHSSDFGYNLPYHRSIVATAEAEAVQGGLLPEGVGLPFFSLLDPESMDRELKALMVSAFPNSRALLPALSNQRRRSPLRPRPAAQRADVIPSRAEQPLATRRTRASSRRGCCWRRRSARCKMRWHTATGATSCARTATVRR